MRLVKQQNGFSCGIACVAMVTGKRFATVAKVFGRDCSEEVEGLPWRDQTGGIGKRLGVTGLEICWVLYSFGVPAGQYCAREYHPHWGDAAWDLTCVAKDHHLEAHVNEGGTAIMGVPSLNIPDGSHWVVVSGKRVFDPSRLKTYQALSEIASVQEAILIGKSPAQRRARSARGTTPATQTETLGG